MVLLLYTILDAEIFPILFAFRALLLMSNLIPNELTGAQLRHNDFRIFADRSSRNNSENGKTLVICLTVL